jgi:hypothetical protein
MSSAADQFQAAAEFSLMKCRGFPSFSISGVTSVVCVHRNNFSWK